MKPCIHFFLMTLLLLGGLSFPAGAKEETTIDIIPRPCLVEAGKGTFKAAGAIFNCDPRIDRTAQKAIREFADKITFVSGRICSFATPVGLSGVLEGGKYKGFLFIRDDAMGPETYSIDITSRACVVKAGGRNGFLYSLQTLKQLMPVSIFGSATDSKEKFFLPCLRISDQPRFGYRGLLLDCARHFYPVEDIKKTLDLMLVFKLNRFHWHLTDDQGWRVEIKRYPLLTQVGAFRSGTMVGKDFESNDGVRYGGYYTQEQMREIVEYADERGITVIPEIDLPGHMQGALAAYPSLGCTGGPYEVRTIWGVSEQVLCAGKEETYRFLEDVFTELMDIFPSEYFHIGGDECPKKEWSQCPACQERIRALGLKADEKHSAEVYLQNYVTARVQKFLSDHGRKIIGWDEIFEGDLAEGATVMSWRGVESGLKAAAAGYDVVMTPKWYCYLNYLQSEDPSTEPLGHGHFLPLDKAYSYEPFEGLDAAAEDHILGVQANMWTEYIGTQDYMEYMLLPRLCAIAEVNWSRREDRDYDRFYATLQRKTYSLFKTLGYNYRTY